MRTYAGRVLKVYAAAPKPKEVKGKAVTERARRCVALHTTEVRPIPPHVKQRQKQEIEGHVMRLESVDRLSALATTTTTTAAAAASPFAALPEGVDATEIPETEQVWPQVRSCLAAYLPVSLSLCVSCRLSLAILLHACLSVCLPSCLSVGRSIFLRYPLA